MGEQIRIGQIVSTQGLKGDVRVYPLTDYKERFEELQYITLEDDRSNLKLEIEKVRYKGKLIILKFKGLNNINDVEKLKDKYIVIDKDEARDLPEDTYYIFDLIGSKVVDEEDSHIGKLVDVMQNTAQDLYVIEYKSTKKKIFVPAVKEFIKEVNIEDKIIKVKLIEGMIE
ncbi:ribosome maturation factor RimM [Wukongibacter baidiensis]|uniref:ribosome maturation factor RimM n=1 Tax=Wukongibacter baidiensis TaxID=1723361 RepID=UPI003D7F1A5A